MSEGQFDDANEEEDEFVAQMNFKMMLPRSQDDTRGQNRKDPSNKEEKFDDHMMESNASDWEAETDDEEEDEEFYTLTTAGGHKSIHLGAATNNPSPILLGKGTTAAQAAMQHSVSNTLHQMQNLETTKRSIHTGRDERATSEQVLDPRTRLMLFKFLSTGFIELLDGCLSTGKEANVYYAKAGPRSISLPAISYSSPSSSPLVTEYAIKIYKTSILVFKDRDKYVSGEYRWRRGYCKSNPRKMVKVWAEKEMRNYKRLFHASIPCPQPILLKSHLLVMEFLGENGWPSPRLKDAQLSENKMRQAYVQSILIMRHMFRRCKLVHGDLSEYNLLWHQQQVYVIDVSQSVESDHPAALDFLRKDATNINEFFRKFGHLQVMSTRQLFEFVTSSTILDTMDSESQALDEIMHQVEYTSQQLAQQTPQEQMRAQQLHQVDEAVFMSQFLPRSLNQLKETDIQKIQTGDVEEMYAHAVAAMTSNIKKDSLDESTSLMEKENDDIQVNDDSSSSRIDDYHSLEDKEEYSDDDDDDDDEDTISTHRKKPPPLTLEERQRLEEYKRQERKDHKKAVKEEQREKRLNKMKKKDKKKAIEKTKGKKK